MGRDVRTQGGKRKDLGCRTQPLGSAACDTWIWGREWRMFDLGRGMEDKRQEMPQTEAGLGWDRARLPCMISVCLSVLSPPGAAFALPVPLVAAEVHAHLPPVPPAQQPPSQGSPVPHRQEALRQHLRFPVSCRGAAGAPQTSNMGLTWGCYFSSGSHIENWHSILRNGLVNASYTKLQVRTLLGARQPPQGGQAGRVQAAACRGRAASATQTVRVTPRRSPRCFPASCMEQPMARASISAPSPVFPLDTQVRGCLRAWCCLRCPLLPALPSPLPAWARGHSASRQPEEQCPASFPPKPAPRLSGDLKPQRFLGSQSHCAHFWGVPRVREHPEWPSPSVACVPVCPHLCWGLTAATCLLRRDGERAAPDAFKGRAGAEVQPDEHNPAGDRPGDTAGRGGQGHGPRG